MEYIDREKLIEKLRKDPLFDLVERYGITGVIESIPAADVRPVVRGKWELQADLLTWEGTFDGYFCSKCGKGYLDDLCCGNGEHYVDVTKEFNFCPNCGADMREES